MRIVAGRFRGRPLLRPDDARVRPTSDRVRESLFNILQHGIAGFDLSGARVIDLFSGTGALGLEALSRGARFCLFVDNDAKSRAIVRGNVEAMGLTGETRLFRRDATDLGPIGTMAPFDLALLDPPYAQGLAERAMTGLVAERWLTPKAVIVVEEQADIDVAPPAGFVRHDWRRYASTGLSIFVREAAAGA